MSLTASYRTEIIIPKPQMRAIEANVQGVPCMDVLRSAMESIAREHQGRIGNMHRDCNGRDIPCLLSLETRSWPRGLGIVVGNDGRVRFEYDAQGVEESAAQSLCDDLARAYTVIAVLKVQQRCGYEVSVLDDIPTRSGRVVTALGVT